MMKGKEPKRKRIRKEGSNACNSEPVPKDASLVDIKQYNSFNHVKADIDTLGPSITNFIEIEDMSMEDDIYGQPAMEGIHHNVLI